MMEQGPTRDLGTTLHLERGRAREADLDQALDGGVEERAAGFVAPLLLCPRCTSGLGHCEIVYRPRNSQSRLFVCNLAESAT